MEVLPEHLYFCGKSYGQRQSHISPSKDTLQITPRHHVAACSMVALAIGLESSSDELVGEEVLRMGCRVPRIAHFTAGSVFRPSEAGWR
jgi:hypothetical protein